jgi:hypothetical protein
MDLKNRQSFKEFCECCEKESVILFRQDLMKQERYFVCNNYGEQYYIDMRGFPHIKRAVDIKVYYG